MASAASMRGISFIVSAVDNASRTIQKVNQNVRLLNTTSVKTANSMFGAFGTMIAGTAALGAGVVGLGAAFKSVSAATEFEYAMERVGIVTRAVGPEFEAMRKEAMRLGLETEFTATEVAGAFQTLAQAGYSAKEIIGGLGSVVLDLSSASGGMIDTAKAAGAIVSAVKVFPELAGDARKASDMLVRTTQMSRIQFDDLERALAGVSGEARMYNQDFAEVLALMSSAKDIGFSAASGANAVRISMRNLFARNKELLEISGGTVSAYENGVRRSFTAIMADLDKFWKKTGATQQQVDEDIMKIMSKRGLRGAAIILKDTFKDASGTVVTGADAIYARMKKIQDSTGATAEAAKRMRETFMGTLKRIVGGLGTMAIMIGDTIVPALSMMAEKLFDVIVSLNYFISSHKDFVKFSLIIFTTASAFLVLTGAILMAVSALWMFTLFMGIAGVGGGTFVGVLAAMWAVLWPVTLAMAVLTVSVVAAAGAIAVINRAWKEHSATIKSVGLILGAFIAFLGGGPAVALLGLYVDVKLLIKVFKDLSEKFKGFMKLWGDQTTRIKTAIEPIRTFFQALWMLMTNDFRITEDMFNKIQDKGLLGALTTIGSLLLWIERGLRAVGIIVGIVWNAIMKVLGGALAFLTGSTNEAIYGLFKVFKLFLQFIGGDISGKELWKGMNKAFIYVMRKTSKFVEDMMVKVFAMDAEEWGKIGKLIVESLWGGLKAQYGLGWLLLNVIGFFAYASVALGVSIAVGIVQGIAKALWDNKDVLLGAFAKVMLYIFTGIAALVVSIFTGPLGGMLAASGLVAGTAGIGAGKLYNAQQQSQAPQTPQPGQFQQTPEQLGLQPGSIAKKIYVTLKMDKKVIDQAVVDVDEDNAEMRGQSATPLSYGNMPNG